jgi:hypothetical protein
MEDEGSSSNRGKQEAPPEATEANATSSTSSSSSESGKISGLDWSASSRESGSTSSISSSDENSSSGGGSYVEIILSNTDVGKRDADVEEGEIGEDADAAVEEAAEGSGEKADLRDLAKARTCYIGRSLMTQADLDALRLEGCFEPGTCRLPGKETTPKPRKNESVVFRDFFTAGLRLPVSKKFADILAAYNIQIHQLTPNSIPQVLKFLWACRTFAGDNDVDTFVRHFEIH